MEQTTNLKLTLALRDHFFFVPLAVTTFALLLAVVAAGLGPDYVGLWTRSRAVDKELDQNETALDNHRPDGIVGLDREWVNATTLDRSGNTLLRTIRDVRRHGPIRAGEARARLKRRLEDEKLEESLPPERPLWRAASAEANRSENRITDFLDGTAEPVTHPADDMIATLNRFVALGARLDKLDDHIKRTSGIEEDRKKLLRARLEEVQRFLAVAGDETSISDVDALADQVQGQVIEAAEPLAPRPTAALVAEMGGEQAAILPSRHLPAAAPLLANRALTGPRAPARTIRTGRWWPSFTEDLAIALAFLALMAVAAISVAASDYFPTATFGSTGDYFALFAAALGTASASGILTSLFLWKPSSQD